MKLHDLSLATRVTIGVLAIVIAGTATLMLVEKSRRQDVYIVERRAHLENDIETESLRLSQTVDTLQRDVLFLSNIPPISGIVRASLNHGYDARDADPRAKWEKRLFGIFSAFTSANPEYYRIRYIGLADGGRELARVDHRHGLIGITPPGQLLSQGDRDYFKPAMKLRQGQVWLSEISLGTDIDNFPVRTLCAVTPVFTPSGERFGMVVIHMDVSGLLKQAVSDVPGVQTYLANMGGQYLLHPDLKRTFKFESGSMDKIAAAFPFIASMFTPEVPDYLPLQTVAKGTGSSLFTAKRIRFDSNDTARFLLLMYYIPGAVVAEQVAPIPVNTILDEFLMMLLVGGIATLVLRRTFSPLKQITRAANKISGGNYDILLPRADGGEIGSLTSALNTMLTNLSQREKLLRESETRYRRLHESMMDAYVMVGMSGRLLEFNHVYREMLGYSDDELRGMRYVDLTPEKWHELEVRIVEEQVIRQGYSQVYEEEYVRKDGTVFPVELKVFLLRDQDGKPEAMWAIVRDITGRKQADLRLRQSAAEIEDLYNHAPCGYHSLNQDGLILIINDTELAWLGYSRDEIVGKRSLADLLTADSLPIFQQTFLQLKEAGEIHDVELELVRNDGTIIPVMISATALYDEDDNFIMSRSTVYDMTERKKMEQEHIGYLKRLEEVSHHLVAAQEDTRRRLSSELHDRTSPNLAAIEINLNIISRDLPPEHSAGLSESLEDTRALIADTAASIREICAERPPLLDYAGLAAAMESYVQQFARRTGIAVEFDCANRDTKYPPELESLLFRMFQEAMTNCAKHAHATSIRVILSGGHPIVMTITDDGVGFDPARLGKSGQVGLGLINMREMAEVANGRLTIESVAGNGTRVAVEIA